MTAIAFDALKFAKRLKDGGFTEQQAEALATVGTEFVEDNLATRRNLKELELAVQRYIKELEAALRRDIKELDTKIEQIRAALKRDIEEFRADLERDIKELETRAFREMKDLEYRMTIKLRTLMVVAIGAMATWRNSCEAYVAMQRRVYPPLCSLSGK
jgi:septal ring factor EnvC (AmiA/AmiB activator)